MPKTRVACFFESQCRFCQTPTNQHTVLVLSLTVVLCGAGAPDGTMATVTVRTAVGAVLGHVTLTYEADVTGDILQIYGRLLDAACSAMIDQSLVTPPLLDAILTGAVFDDTGSRSSAHELPLRAFELLFESAKYAASGIFMSNFLATTAQF